MLSRAQHLQLEHLQHQDLHQSGPVESQQASFSGRHGVGRLPALLASSLDHGAAAHAGTCSVGAGENGGCSARGDGGAFGDPSGCCCQVRGLWAGRGALLSPPVGACHAEWAQQLKLLSVPLLYTPSSSSWGMPMLAGPSGRQELAHGSVLRQRKGASSAAGPHSQHGSRFPCSEPCKH